MLTLRPLCGHAIHRGQESRPRPPSCALDSAKLRQYCARRRTRRAALERNIAQRKSFALSNSRSRPDETGIYGGRPPRMRCSGKKEERKNIFPTFERKERFPRHRREQAANPILAPSVGLADPYVHVWSSNPNVAYVYATHDCSKSGEGGQRVQSSRGNLDETRAGGGPCAVVDGVAFRMYDWWVWSTTDLVSWTPEARVLPSALAYETDDEAQECWATDAASRAAYQHQHSSSSSSSAPRKSRSLEALSLSLSPIEMM